MKFVSAVSRRLSLGSAFRVPLKLRLGLVLAVAAIVLAMGQAAVDHYLVGRALLKDASDEIGDTAIRAAEGLGRSALNLRDALQAATTFAIGTRSLVLPTAQDVAYIRETLESLRRQTPHVAWIGLTTVEGHLIAGAGRSTDEPVGVQDGRASTLTLEIPIERGGRIDAVLRVRPTAHFMSEVERSTMPQFGRGTTFQLLVASSNGRVLYGPADTLGQTLPADLLEGTASGGNPNRIAEWPDRNEYLSAPVATVGYRGVVFPDWHVIVRQPAAEALRRADMIKTTRILSSAALAAAFALLGWVLASRLATPLQRISAAASAWRSGHADVSIPVIDRPDEVGELSRSLHVLVDGMSKHSEALRVSESRFREIFEASPVALCVVDFAPLQSVLDEYRAQHHKNLRRHLERDPDFLPRALGLVRVLDVNRTALRMMQSAKQSDLARPLADVIGEPSMPLFWEMFLAIAEGSTQFEGSGTLATPAGDSHPVQCSVAVPGSPPDYGRVLVAFADLTERANAERELRASEERFRLLVDGVKDYSIIMLDAEGRVASWNAGAERIEGYTAAEAIGQPAYMFYTNEAMAAERPAQLLELARESGSASEEGWRVRKDGSRFLAHVVITALRDEGGGLYGYSQVTRDVTELRLAAQRIEHLATHDPLTNLPNRLLLQDRLNQALAAARREGTKIALMFVDLDRFKYVNDSLGHHVGDALLKEAATRMSATLRQADTVARQGGDEFILLLPSVYSGFDVDKIAGKIRDRMSKPFMIEGQQVVISASVGITMFPDDGEDAATLLRNADIAMYNSKGAGGNTARFFSAQMSSDTMRRTLVEQELRKAIETEAIEVHFQPQVRLESSELVGFEALARWHHPSLGEIPPTEFIRIAEEIGVIDALGEQILRVACAQAASWPARGLPPVRVAVNVSPKQLAQSEFTKLIAEVLRDSGLAPSRLELEITESVAIEFAAGSAATLQAIASLGVKLAIDDFGAGYAGLSYLKQLPIDTIKIDRTFIRDAPGDQEDVAIITAVISMARSLGVTVCAEGVENADQSMFLSAVGCDFAQGFYYGEAGPAKDVSAVVNTHAQTNVIPLVRRRRPALAEAV